MYIVQRYRYFRRKTLSWQRVRCCNTVTGSFSGNQSPTLANTPPRNPELVCHLWINLSIQLTNWSNELIRKMVTSCIIVCSMSVRCKLIIAIARLWKLHWMGDWENLRNLRVQILFDYWLAQGYTKLTAKSSMFCF